MGEVVGVDAARKEVLLADRKISYDYLVIATGAKYNYFGHPEWEQYAPGLKTILDATSIRAKILLAFEQAEMEADEAKRKALLTFAIVGAGPTGVEMAGSIAELAHKALERDFRHVNPSSTRIVLIEAGPRILAAFSTLLADEAQAKLIDLGVEVQTKATVERVDADGVVVNGQRLNSKTVIWAAGVVASPAGKWLAAEVDRVGRVNVNNDLSVRGHPEVFVLGDTASVTDENGKPLPGVAPVAMQQGRYAAEVIKERIRGQQYVRSFEYLDKGNLATVGRAFAIAERGKVHVAGILAWWMWVAVHIFYLIGFRNRVLVMLQWAWAYLTFQRGARLITREIGVPKTPL